MSPGKDTRELLASAEDRARIERAAELEQAKREAKLERELDRERLLRRLLWGAIVLIGAAIGTAGLFWDDYVRKEVRLEFLEQEREERKVDNLEQAPQAPQDGRRP